MKKFRFVWAGAVLLAMFGCGGSGSADEKNSTDSTAMGLSSNAESKEPAKPAFSKEAADKLLKDMEACSSPYSCEAVKELVEFGVDAVPQLSAVAVDASKSQDVRKSALYALQEIKTNPGGAELFAAGKSEKDFMTRGDYFKAAALTTDEALLHEMLAYSISKEAHKADHHTDMLVALGHNENHAKVMDWIKSQPKFSGDEELDIANHVDHHGSASDIEFASQLEGKFKDLMAKSELAAFRVRMGDMSGFDQLMKGMKASDKYDRSHAGGCFSSEGVYDKCPADKKAEAVKLLEKIQKENATGFESREIKEALEFLKK